MYKRAFAAALAVFLFVSVASAQKAELTISLNEAFFDALLDSVFQNFDPPEFLMAQNRFNRTDIESERSKKQRDNGKNGAEMFYTEYRPAVLPPTLRHETPVCRESVKILRDINGVRTAVRFREGKIYMPLAFTGSYAPPFIGCVEFAGWAETNLQLEFDQDGQRLIGRVKVFNVNLNGTRGIGGTVIAKLIQTSIDKKLNPIDILTLDNLSFGIPVQKVGNLRMKALRVRPEVGNAVLNVKIEYEFLKG